MSPEQLASIAGVVLSLAFSHVPGLSGWYEGQNSQAKALIMGALLLVVAIGAYLLSCAGPYDYFTCDVAGGWTAVEVFILALVANQGVHLLDKAAFPRK